jgi:PTS system ascorbate-specific IIB component
MKLLAVCGMGIGTSVLLKMNAERVLEQLGIEADVDATDITTALRDDSPAQIVLCTPELRDQLRGIRAEIITVDNVFDLNELTEKLQGSLL